MSQSCISGITLLIEMAMEYGSSPVAHPEYSKYNFIYQIYSPL
jgi:hypothetical protein